MLSDSEKRGYNVAILIGSTLRPIDKRSLHYTEINNISHGKSWSIMVICIRNMIWLSS